MGTRHKSENEMSAVVDMRSADTIPSREKDTGIVSTSLVTGGMEPTQFKTQLSVESKSERASVIRNTLFPPE